MGPVNENNNRQVPTTAVIVGDSTTGFGLNAEDLVCVSSDETILVTPKTYTLSEIDGWEKLVSGCNFSLTSKRTLLIISNYLFMTM